MAVLVAVPLPLTGSLATLAVRNRRGHFKKRDGRFAQSDFSKMDLQKSYPYIHTGIKVCHKTSTFFWCFVFQAKRKQCVFEEEEKAVSLQGSLASARNSPRCRDNVPRKQLNYTRRLIRRHSPCGNNRGPLSDPLSEPGNIATSRHFLFVPPSTRAGRLRTDNTRRLGC